MNRPKIKGTLAESAVVAYLRTVGFAGAERLALQGGKDRGDLTGLGPLVCEVKNCQEYSFSAWLKEAEVERDNAKADFGFVVAKPRLVGTTRTGQWYALMYEGWWHSLLHEAGVVRVWTQEMSGNSISTQISKMLKLAQAHQSDSGSTHSCVRIAPKGVKDTNLYYVVTTLEQMSDLLVRAGYGRRDDPTGA